MVIATPPVVPVQKKLVAAVSFRAA